MKKQYVALVLTMTLFLCAACGNVVDENDTESTTTTAAQNQDIDITRIPHWAEGMNIDGDETISIKIDRGVMGSLSFDDLILFATDIVRVEVFSEEKVELINGWYPAPKRESPDVSREEIHPKTETTSASQSNNLEPFQKEPTFRAPTPEEEEQFREYRERHERYDIFTVYYFRVLEVYKGTTRAGEKIEVMRRGGQLGKFSLVDNMWNDAGNTFVAGDELVLFLGFGEKYRNPDIPDWVPNPEEALQYIQNMPYSFISANQSIYRVMPGGRIESVSPKNSLTITTAELAQIAQRSRVE
jgi:hypothetical protein